VAEQQCGADGRAGCDRPLGAWAEDLQARSQDHGPHESGIASGVQWGRETVY